MIRDPELPQGSEGVVIYANGTIELILPDLQGRRHDLTERHQALVGAALQCVNDPDFRAHNAAQFKLYLSQPVGVA